MPRSFDVEQNEHPVGWLVEAWKESKLAPMYLWLNSLVGDGHAFSPDIKTLAPVS